MSVATLYQTFNEAITGGQTVDVLASEVGGDLGGKLAAVPPVTGVLGDAWVVSEAAIKDPHVAQEERQVLLPVFIPQTQTTQVKRSRRGQELQAFVNTRPAQHTTRIHTVVVDVVQSFVLEGRIGDEIQFVASFWQEGATLKYYAVFGLPNAFLATLFAGVYWPELAACRFARLRILVFSHFTRAFQCDWHPGIYFLSDFRLGPNLWAATGNADPVFLGGSIGVENDQITFKFFSWPNFRLSFDGGLAVIRKVWLDARTRAWSDGVVPRTIEGATADPDVDDGSPEPLDSQFALSGHLAVADELAYRVWSPLPKDDGLVCFNLVKHDGKLPDAALLAGIVGDQAWLEALDGKLENYTLRELTITIHLPSRRLVSVSAVLEGSFFVESASPDKLFIDPARISCLISHPSRVTRHEHVEVTGPMTAYGTTFDAHLTMPALVLTLASADGEGFDKWKDTFWYQEVKSSGRFLDSEVEGTFTTLHVEADLRKKEFWASASNEAGGSRWL